MTKDQIISNLETRFNEDTKTREEITKKIQELNEQVIMLNHEREINGHDLQICEERIRYAKTKLEEISRSPSTEKQPQDPDVSPVRHDPIPTRRYELLDTQGSVLG